ncbi:MAG: leucine-rich repeat domain-containing protein [Blautia sp.]|nr:leucine-rich repeat domain-containing protein [Blautia sp.]
MSYLQIPETLEDRPVTQIAASAFSGRTDLIYAKLPATITKLGRFAFYGCSALEKISLSDGIIDYGDGVFRQCRNMHEAELDIREQRYYVLKELLADTDRVITADITFPDGRARLTFPEYLFEYIEDTRARAIHLHIEGTGYNYRECVSRKSIDFRSYDRSFEKLRSASPSLACRIAMDRLCFPYNLEKSASDSYQEHLRTFGKDAAALAVLERRTDWLQMLTAKQLLSADALHDSIQFASQKDLPECVAILASALPRKNKKGRMML